MFIEGISRYVFSNRMAKIDGMNGTKSRAVSGSVLGSSEFGSAVQLTGMGW
jgi:hypothetical protein